jgi:tetratricopeptide (TPR) repeat protein
VGKRVITTIPVGKIGNEQPIQVISESWVSPELKLTVRESDDDPRTGKRTMEMTHISREDPAADLFEAPAGYTVKERPNFLNFPIARASSPVHDLETQQIAEARKDPGPVLKNDVAYKLAMEKIDLPEAQELAEQGVQIAEQHTADLDPNSAEVFSQMDTLSRYWNTLGWVYFRQGNLAEAETYTRAAWQLSPQGYFGAHLGRIYEDQNRPKDAITIYRKALSARQSEKEREQILSRLADLGVASPEPLPQPELIPFQAPTDQHKAPVDETLLDIVVKHGRPPVLLLRGGSPSLLKSAAAAIEQAAATRLPDGGPETVVWRAWVTCQVGKTHECALRFLTPQEARAAGASLSN